MNRAQGPGGARRRGRGPGRAADEEVLDYRCGLESKPYPLEQPSAGSLILFSGLSKSWSLPPIFSPQPQRYWLHEGGGAEKEDAFWVKDGTLLRQEKDRMPTAARPSLSPGEGTLAGTGNVDSVRLIDCGIQRDAKLSEVI